MATLVLPPVTVTVTYHPSSKRLKVEAPTEDPDLVVLALAKALHIVLSETVKAQPLEG